MPNSIAAQRIRLVCPAQICFSQINLCGELMPSVIDANDLGSGVIGGVECDHLAFRTEEVDWQIWIWALATASPLAQL